MFYVVKIVFRVCRKGESLAEFDEQLRLIEAADEIEAYQKAILFGKTEEGDVESSGGEKVFWKMIDVKEMQALHTLNNGSFLWSSGKTTSSAEEYVTFVKARAARYRAALQTATSSYGHH